MAERALRLGTRASRLAVAQSRLVAQAIRNAYPEIEVELVPIRTRGDREPGDLKRLGGKGLFTAELERGLLDGSLHLAVHSLKDLAVERPEGTSIAATPARADARDCLVSEFDGGVANLPQHGRVLTGSARRAGQLLAARPDLQIESVRGNVETRIERWRDQGADAVVLAMAGLQRLDLRNLPIQPLSPDLMVPAPGQGVLAVETRRGGETERLCQALDHPPTARVAAAERAVIAAFGGDCFLPLGAWASHDEEGQIHLVTWLGTPDGRTGFRATATAPEPERAAVECVQVLRRHGAEEVLRSLDR